MKGYQIIIADKDSDLKKIAQCRIAAFPASLSSKLGSSYVSGMLSMFIEKNNFMLYIQENNECIGFVTALVPDNEHSCSTREAINFTFNDLLIGMLYKPWLFFHPIVLKEYKVGLEMIKKKLGSKLQLKSKQGTEISKLAPEIINSVGCR